MAVAALSSLDEADNGNYESEPEIDKITACLQKNKGREFIRIMELYSSMSGAGRKKLVRYAGRLIKGTSKNWHMVRDRRLWRYG